jgi:hypothetical protein
VTIGHKLGLRLFLEGVEVPVIGASVTAAANVPSTCTVQLIATNKILEILPRTLVHVFFYDFVNGEAGYDSGLLEDIENSAYKLLFVGEVNGIAFQKDVGSRAVMLNCVDLSNYWDTTYQYNFKGSLLGGRKHAAFIGANANWMNGPLGRGVGSISALLNGRSVNYPELKGLLAGIVRVLETIGGSYYGDTTFRGANDFTAIAELRLKILQQITAAEKDDSTAKLFARKTFNRWMNRQLGGLGKLVTFRGLTQLLQKFVFHDIYPCPAPKYIPRRSGLPKTKTFAMEITEDPRSRKFIADVKRLRQLLQSAKQNIEDYPLANASSNLSVGNVSVEKVGRSKVAESLRTDLYAAYQLVSRMITAGIPKIPGLEALIARINDDIQAVYKHLGRNVTAKNLSFAVSRTAASKWLTNAVQACDSILEVKIKRSRTTTYDTLDRLNNQVLRPDIWFVPPPRCNVLFPELYSSFSWSRNFLREVSRLELQTTHELLGDDALFNKRYYAPNVADMRSGVRLSSRKFGRLTLKHELMTGIIPMFEKMTEANIYSMKGRKVKHKGAPVSYAQRAVNFQYFKHRFASRQMQCQGRFNPWFVPGFPGLIIDRPMDAANILIAGLPIEEQISALDIKPESGIELTRGSILREIVPTQFLGCCVHLSHSLSQQGGNTSYAFGQARIHREDTEYLGVDKADISKKVGTARRGTPVAALPSRAPKEKKRGPRGGRVLSVEDVTNQYYDSYLPVYGSHPKTNTGAAFLEVRVGSSPNSSSTETYRAYKVKEEYTRRARIQVDLPLEDAIRPPWIWDGYTDVLIGDTYMQFFGINSITDIEGYTSDKLLSSLAGADSREAAQEVQEGITYGTQKSDNDDSYEWAPATSSKEQDKPRKNKAKKGTSQAEEVGRKVGAETILAMETDRTIENSIDYLVRVYSFIKYYGLDVGGFLRNYTWRPVATLPEIMGSVNFYITERSKHVPNVANADFDPFASEDDSDLFVTEAEDAPVKIEGDYIISGREGFHSRAFGDVSDLFGLVDPKVDEILGLSRDKKHAATKRLDVRGLKRAAIWAYMQELASSRGLLG